MIYNTVISRRITLSESERNTLEAIHSAGRRCHRRLFGRYAREAGGEKAPGGSRHGRVIRRNTGSFVAYVFFETFLTSVFRFWRLIIPTLCGLFITSELDTI